MKVKQNCCSPTYCHLSRCQLIYSFEKYKTLERFDGNPKAADLNQIQGVNIREQNIRDFRALTIGKQPPLSLEREQQFNPILGLNMGYQYKIGGEDIDLEA